MYYECQYRQRTNEDDLDNKRQNNIKHTLKIINRIHALVSFYETNTVEFQSRNARDEMRNS